MLLTRVIPALLIKNRGLVKGVHFKDHRYVGDAMNTIRIFNTKEVDELMILDIEATEKKATISPDFIRQISTECLMPITVGGGIRTVEHARALLGAGAEKVAIGTAAATDPSLLRRIAETFGSQSLVVSIDVKNNIRDQHEIFSHCGKINTHRDPIEYAQSLENLGTGELLVNAIDRDGDMQGYDIELLRKISGAVRIPVIALGGAGSVAHLGEAVKSGGATAVAAGSFFVFHGKRRAVLISFPTRKELNEAFSNELYESTCHGR